MKIEFSRLAAQDLRRLYEFIQKDNPSAATKVVRRIFSSIESLHLFPYSGRLGRVVPSREIVVNGTPFIVVYLVSTDRVSIVRVLHGSQQWPKEST